MSNCQDRKVVVLYSVSKLWFQLYVCVFPFIFVFPLLFRLGLCCVRDDQSSSFMSWSSVSLFVKLSSVDENKDVYNLWRKKTKFFICSAILVYAWIYTFWILDCVWNPRLTTTATTSEGLVIYSWSMIGDDSWCLFFCFCCCLFFM